MPDGSMRLGLLILCFTLASGVCDSFAFTYSSRMWQDGRLLWGVASKAGASFAIGITLYWVAVRYLAEAGIVMPEVQTLIWFTVTIVGVAIIGGHVASWRLVDQIVGVNVIASIAWLIVRTAV